MKNDLKRFEIADAQADCTVARSRWLVSSVVQGCFGWGGAEKEGHEGWRRERRRERQREGGDECKPPFSGQWSFPVTAVLLSRGGGSSTGREAAWDRWTCPAPPPLSPPMTASLIKNTSWPQSECSWVDAYAVCGRVEVANFVWLPQILHRFQTAASDELKRLQRPSVEDAFKALPPLSYLGTAALCSCYTFTSNNPFLIGSGDVSTPFTCPHIATSSL